MSGTTYTITETQPLGYVEGKDTAGNLGGPISVQDVIGDVALGADDRHRGADLLGGERVERVERRHRTESYV